MADSGKALLCEKPLANSVAEAQAMVAAVDAAGVAHMICHNYRRIPAVVLAKQLIEAGVTPKIVVAFRGDASFYTQSDLAKVKEGARRKDAAEALEQLEPLLASAGAAVSSGEIFEAGVFIFYQRDGSCKRPRVSILYF